MDQPSPSSTRRPCQQRKSEAPQVMGMPITTPFPTSSKVASVDAPKKPVVMTMYFIIK